MSTSSHSRSHSNARLDTIFIHSYPTPHDIINGVSKYCYYVNKYEKTYMFSSRIFILMFLGVLYSWTYHNEQQQPCVVASSTPSTNDIAPNTAYAIDVSERV
eukprot:793725_1